MDALLDTSWSLHHISTNSNSYHNLFTSSKTTQNHLPRYFDRLPQYLSSQKPSYTDDLGDTENEKLGTLRDCKSTIIRLPSSSSSASTSSQSIQIQLIYQHKTFTFILHTPHLTLSKASSNHTKHTLNFLSETFNISTSPLKLPSTFLSNTLQSYIDTLLLTSPLASLSTHENNDDDNELETEKHAAALSSTIGTLRITIQFSGSVAPNLKNLELNVPYDTVDALIKSSPSPPSSSSNFMSKLAEHLYLQTGLKLPLSVESKRAERGNVNDNEAEIEVQADETSPVKVSKLTCAALAIGVEGKLKFAGRPIEGAGDYASLVIRANLGVLDDIVAEARRQGKR